MNKAHYNYKRGSALAWISLLVGSLALIVAIIAYRQSGKDLNDLVSETTSKTVEEANKVTSTVSEQLKTTGSAVVETANEVAARTVLETKLLALRNRVAVNKADDLVANEVAELRAEYNKAFQNSSASVKAKSVEVSNKLVILENDLRAGTSNILLTLDQSISLLRQNQL